MTLYPLGFNCKIGRNTRRESVFSENLDQLEKTVRSFFDKVENKNVKRTDYSSFENHPWGPEQTKRKVFVVPVVDVYKLKLIFPMPPDEKNYKSAVRLFARIIDYFNFIIDS